MKIYDLEHHYYNPELIKYLSSRDTPPMYKDNVLTYFKGACLPLGEPFPILGGQSIMDFITDLEERRIKCLDEAGIDVAIISSSALIDSLADKKAAVRYARITNDAVAEACRKHPDRFLGTISLPTIYVDEAMEELDRAVNELGLKYWHTHSNYGNEILADDKFLPLLEKCEKLNIPIYLHPHNSASEYLNDSGMLFSSAGFGFSVDTMKTCINIVLKGRLDQFPNLKIILGHMGEFFPYILKRLDNRFFCIPDPAVQCKHNFEYYFKNKNIFVTTSGMEDPDVVEFAIKKIGIDSIMFGTDFPLEDMNQSVKLIQNLPISESDKEKIFYKNAEKYILK